jgi:hypothetical protein
MTGTAPPQSGQVRWLAALADALMSGGHRDVERDAILSPPRAGGKRAVGGVSIFLARVPECAPFGRGNMTMSYSRDMLDDAYWHTSRHREELEQSDVCGCFYCCRIFTVAEIERWLPEGSGTAFCPHCGIDSVMGSASGYPVSEPQFLQAMHAHWFSPIGK